MTTPITATTTRSGRWWTCEFTIDGQEYGTQAKRLDQIPAMVKDAASLMTGLPKSEFEVRVVVQQEDINQLVDLYASTADRLRKAESEAQLVSRDTVAKLRAQHLSVREISHLLGISYQRVSQLANS